MRKKHDKAIATALVIGYSSVFVIHPAVLGILFGSVLSPGRAFADESERIYQQIQNIGMTLGILPITGITLPFISYGGSSLLSYMLMIGILLNIHNDTYKTIN